MGQVLSAGARRLARALVIVAVSLPLSVTVQEPAAVEASARAGKADATWRPFFRGSSLPGRRPFGSSSSTPSRRKPWARRAVAAAGAAQQGRFWDMHNVLFANQDCLTAADCLAMGEQIALDMALFRDALAAPEPLAARHG